MDASIAPSRTQNLAWADRAGTWASVACVIHCLFTPVVLSFSAVIAHALPSEERVHRSLAVLVAAIGTAALFRGFRIHRRRAVLGLMLAGLACISFGAWWGDQFPHHWIEVAVTFCGSALMISAHRLNHTFCGSCHCATGRNQAL